MVVQQTWPGCPQASHSDAPPITTQVLSALHDVPQHGSPATPHRPEELPSLPALLPKSEPPLLPDADPPLSLPELDPMPPEPDPPLRTDTDPPLPSPEPSSAPGGSVPTTDVDLPPQPTSDRARISSQAPSPR